MEIAYEAHQALADESNEGWILIRPSPKDKKLGKACKPGRRPIVRIKGKNFKAVYAEVLYADDTYLNKRKTDPNFCTHSDTLIFLSAWYRNLLGIENKLGSIKLDIKPVHPLALVALLYRYPRNHPQALVRAANMMAIIGVGLGFIGIGLGLLGIAQLLSTNIPGYLFCIAGSGFTGTGFIGLIRR